MSDGASCEHSFDPLLNSLSLAVYHGAPYKGEASSPQAAVYSATVAVLAMVKLGSNGIRATIGQGNCGEPWHWLVTAKHHHASRCLALACAQCLWDCDACHELEAATPDLHGCEHHGANRALHGLLLEWLCQARLFVVEVADKLGQTGYWDDSDAATLPDPYPFEELFGLDTHRFSKD